MSNLSRRDALRLTGGIALLGSFALAGCGRSDDTTAKAGAEPIASSPATGTITVWAAQGDADVLDKVIKPFKAANPDLDVKFTLIPNADYYTKLQSAIAAGKGPDVAQFFPESQAQFLDPSILRPVPDGLVDPDSFFTSLWDAGVVKDVAYTVPWYAYTYALVYRSDLAKKAGVEAPKTWDEMVPFFKALQGAGAAHGLGADIGWDIFNGQDAAMYAWQAGGSLLSSGGEWTLDTPAMVDAITYNASFYTSGTADTAGPGFLDSQPYFVSGRTATMITGPWVIGQLDAAAKKDGWTASHVATAPLPAGSRAASPSPRAAVGGACRHRQRRRVVEAHPVHIEPEHAGVAVQGVQLAACGRLRLEGLRHRGPAAAGRLLDAAEEHPGVPAGQYLAAGRDPAGQGDGSGGQGRGDRREGRREPPVVRREPRHGHGVIRG